MKLKSWLCVTISHQRDDFVERWIWGLENVCWHGQIDPKKAGRTVLLYLIITREQFSGGIQELKAMYILDRSFTD